MMIYILIIFFSLFSSLYSHAETGRDLSVIEALLQSEKVTEAAVLLQKEIQEHPENAGAHHLLGRIHLLEGNEIAASEAFDKAISIDKAYRDKTLPEYYRAGLILLDDPKKSNIGLHYLNKYLLGNRDRSPEIASILRDKGLDMIRMNRFMAHVILERAMELNPPYEKDESFYFAYAVRSANKSADVVRGGEDFLKRFPESSHAPEVLYLMGEAYLDLRKPMEARKYFKRLTAEYPETEWGKKAANK